MHKNKKPSPPGMKPRNMAQTIKRILGYLGNYRVRFYNCAFVYRDDSSDLGSRVVIYGAVD